MEGTGPVLTWESDPWLDYSVRNLNPQCSCRSIRLSWISALPLAAFWQSMIVIDFHWTLLPMTYPGSFPVDSTWQWAVTH
jgi:hypothetical protein